MSLVPSCRSPLTAALPAAGQFQRHNRAGRDKGIEGIEGIEGMEGMERIGASAQRPVPPVLTTIDVARVRMFGAERPEIAARCSGHAGTMTDRP